MLSFRGKKLVGRIVIAASTFALLFSAPMSANVFATGSNESAESEDSGKDKKKQDMASLQKSIKEKEQQIANAQKEKSNLTKGKTDVEKVKRQLESNKAGLTNYITELDAQVAEIEEKIEQLNLDIEEKERQIEETKAELAEAIEIKDNQYDCMKKRVQAVYEQGDNFYLELLLNAGGLGDFLNQMDYVEDLSRYDDKMFKEYSATVEYVKVCEAQLEEEEALLQETKKAAEDEQKAVEELMDQKRIEIESVSSEIADKEAALREYEAEIAEQNAMIDELERILANAKKELDNMRVYDGGAFCWPCPSYTRVSSDFGYRKHPILGSQLFHNGVDLAAPSGSNILAAYDGEVVAASYTAAMGNYVMLDHGGGLYTVYMHASKLNVSEGKEVKRGDVIAFVGSTGRSTGPHLHFSVRVNGEYVSPWNYITKP